MSFSLKFLPLLLLAGAASGATDAPAGSTPAVAAATASTRPPLVDPARDWPVFLATAEAGTALSAYDVLGKLYAAETGMKADCGTHLAELDASIRTVPVGIALWRAGEVCARLIKDEAAAGFYGEGVTRLAGFALAKDSSGPWNPPVRVVRMDDISALLEATGFEVLYLYGDRSRSPEHMVIAYALWDKDAGRERHLGFDFLDTLYQLKNDEKFAGYPVFRMSMRKAFEATMNAADDDFGKDLSAVDAARMLDGPAAVARLRATAAAGGLGSLRLWIGNCNYRPFEGCADGLVDSLLPFAEEQWSMYNLQLALSYARGIGVKKDLDAALTLVDAAERRWGGGNAYAQFAEQMLELENKPLPSALMERLERAAKAGSGRAGMARMNSLLSADKGNTLDPATLAVVLPLAEQGFGDARIVAYRHFRETGDMKRAIDWLRRDAEAGHDDGMERYAAEMILGKELPRDVAGGRALMRKAAMAGDELAMSWLAEDAFLDKRWKDAEVWYASGVAYENEEAVLGLLRLYELQRPGLEKGPADAAALYEAIQKAGGPGLRRMYADFLLHKAPKRDPAKARQLLAGDADKDSRSQFDLARAMLLGEFGKPEVAEGTALMEKAMAADPKGDVADSLAFFLYYKQRTPEARVRALEIERKLVKQQNVSAMNNLSWWLCTSADPKVRAPAEGLEVAAKMGDADKLASGALDTLAACHAANGQFDLAIAMATKVLDKNALDRLNVEDGELETRLAGYRAGRAYIEPAEDTGE